MFHINDEWTTIMQTFHMFYPVFKTIQYEDMSYPSYIE